MYNCPVHVNLMWSRLCSVAATLATRRPKNMSSNSVECLLTNQNTHQTAKFRPPSPSRQLKTGSLPCLWYSSFSSSRSAVWTAIWHIYPFSKCREGEGGWMCRWVQWMGKMCSQVQKRPAFYEKKKTQKI